MADKMMKDEMKLQRRLFVDMDGTLAIFQKIDTLEKLYEPGYFLNLEPNFNVVNAVKKIINENPDVEVNILSAVLSDSDTALDEKVKWLDKYLPELQPEHRIFPPCGMDKREYLENNFEIKICENDYLLDDYTKNLVLWHPPGSGIKCLNGINHTHGTWQHDCINYADNAEKIAEEIINVMYKQLDKNMLYEEPEM